MYTNFARIYDQLMQDVDYEAWARHYHALLKGCGVQKGARCVECACGTGSLTIPLRKKGLNMTGTDLSEDMLEIAMDKARKAGVMIPFICQDMRNLSLPRRADAVLCTCDGVNYLLTQEDLGQFLTAAANALKIGGVLIFDLSTPHKLRYTLGSNMLNRCDEDYAYLWDNQWDDSTKTVSMLLTLFTRDPGEEKFSRTQEMQTQRAWEMDELKTALENAGFENITFAGGMDLRKPGAADERWHVIAVKKGDPAKTQSIQTALQNMMESTMAAGNRISCSDLRG